MCEYTYILTYYVHTHVYKHIYVHRDQDVAEQSMNAPAEAEGLEDENEVGNMASNAEEELMVPR